MKYHKQMFRHDPDKGVYGDCQRTVIACLLDLDMCDVPHFLEGGCDASEFNRRLDNFLALHHFSRFACGLAADSLQGLLASLQASSPNTVYLLSGLSPRKVNHVVVCRGGEILHDPHPDDGGLIGPCDDGYFWIDVLTPLQAISPASTQNVKR